MTLSLILDQVDASDATTYPHLVSRLSECDRNEITAAMVGVIDRYCGMDPIDMPLARELSAECCR
ncbi:MAG: hypothetical protein L0G27_07780, partial [Paracoccus sp. (in: a-proteobacteria)]|nr:hypothetical protein [Paracoccus sp. (in: a-proteobacteria)]